MTQRKKKKKSRTRTFFFECGVYPRKKMDPLAASAVITESVDHFAFDFIVP